MKKKIVYTSQKNNLFLGGLNQSVMIFMCEWCDWLKSEVLY